MNNILNIPAHTKCTNCGRCCGLVPASQKEIAEIRQYIKKHGIIPEKQGITCPFRNEKEKKCDIYPVRPIICRLMGVTKQTRCPNGNSAEIDGFKLMGEVYNDADVLNFIDW